MTVGVHTEWESAMGWASPPSLALIGWISPSPDLSGEGRLAPWEISSFAIERLAAKLTLDGLALKAVVNRWRRGHQIMPETRGACRDSGGWGGFSVPTGIDAVGASTLDPQGAQSCRAEQTLWGSRANSADKAESSAEVMGRTLQRGRNRSSSRSSGLTPQATDAAARQAPADRQACHPQSSQK